MDIRPKSIGDSFKDIGQGFRTSIPHISIGTPDKSMRTGFYDVPAQIDNKPIPKEDVWLNKLKKWGIAIIVTFVICYAVYTFLW